MSLRTTSVAAAVVCVLALAVGISAAAGHQAEPKPSPQWTTVATGLDNPRGLRFGPDGDIYVAEAGTGGDTSSLDGPDESETEPCKHVPPPIGPSKGGFTSRVTRIDRHGDRTTVADNLPSSGNGLVGGVADVEFVGRTLYALESGAGCSHGLSGTDNDLLRVNDDGTTTVVADLSAFQRTHPVAVIEPSDYEPDGTWYSMVAVGHDIYAVEPNHGEIDRIDTRTGDIDRLIDMSAFVGHVVPTALAVRGRHFFIGNLWHFPIEVGKSSIWRVSGHGDLTLRATGLTTVLGLVPGPDHVLYALESMTVGGFPAGFPGPTQNGSGMIVAVERDGQQTTIATGLTMPGGMTMGPDGALYVSNHSFGESPGTGTIVRVPIPRD